MIINKLKKTIKKKKLIYNKIINKLKILLLEIKKYKRKKE